jgi:hypothetical protein
MEGYTVDLAADGKQDDALLPVLAFKRGLYFTAHPRACDGLFRKHDKQLVMHADGFIDPVPKPRASRRSAPVRFAPVRFVSVRIARLRLAPLRLASVRIARLRLAPLRFAIGC